MMDNGKDLYVVSSYLYLWWAKIQFLPFPMLKHVGQDNK